MLAAIQECEALRPTTRDLIREATSTPDTHDPALSAARYELFRRALIEHDEDAWETLYQAYEPLLISWISKRVTAPQEAYGVLIGEIWMKFLRNIRTADKFSHFANLGGLLAYLKCCALSAVVDHLREISRDKQHFSLETLQEDEHEQVGSTPDLLQALHYQDLLSLIDPLLRNEQERIIVHVLLVEQERPSTLLQWYPGVFSCIDDIYKARRRLIEHLQRSHVLKAAKEAL